MWSAGACTARTHAHKHTPLKRQAAEGVEGAVVVVCVEGGGGEGGGRSEATWLAGGRSACGSRWPHPQSFKGRLSSAASSPRAQRGEPGPPQPRIPESPFHWFLFFKKKRKKRQQKKKKKNEPEAFKEIREEDLREEKHSARSWENTRRRGESRREVRSWRTKFKRPFLSRLSWYFF